MKCVYVYNPTSGKQNSRKKKDYILSKLKTKFDVVDCMATQKAGDAGVFAKQACGKYDVFVVSGGDGTMNEVVNALATQENKPKIGYIPAGTTNDLAHTLRIPKNVKKAVDIILQGNIVSHDVFRAGEKYGIYVCCFGAFTKSSYLTEQSQKKKLGTFAYYKYGIKELFSAKAIPVKFECDGVAEQFYCALAIISNDKYVAGYKTNPKSAFDDGKSEVVFVKCKKKKNGKVPFSCFMKIFSIFLFGASGIKNKKDFLIKKISRCSIEIPNDEVVNLDGEHGFSGSFDYEVLPRHIDIFVK